MENAAVPAATKRLLVIEDEKYLRDLYVEILTAEGFQVDQAADGYEGYVKLCEGGYDLVLLDIVLPKMDGLQILEKLTTTTPKKPNHAIVMFTNLGHHEPVISKGLSLGYSVGVKGYITKSEVTPDKLVDEVKKYL